MALWECYRDFYPLQISGKTASTSAQVLSIFLGCAFRLGESLGFAFRGAGYKRMARDIYRNLAWLPKPPADFSAQSRSLTDSAEQFGARLQALASYSLDETHLDRLGRAIARARQAAFPFSPLTPFRLGVVSNATVDFIIPALEASAARYGIALECTRGAYDQTVQEALNPDSIIHRSNVEAVLVAIDYRGFPIRCKPGDREGEATAVDAALAQLRAIRSGIGKNSRAICILQSLAPSPETYFGSLDRVLPGTPLSVVAAINRGIVDSLRGTPDVLLDVARLAETVGLAEWHSPAQWNMAKLSFANACVPLYADHVARTIAALLGKSRRCLVLDLDNTLWGGVIGDDGLDGIKIAQGDPVGEAYLNVQRYALSLRQRGIVLAVSSKNEDQIARLPFRKHPEMLLRENDFAVFHANWEDKATNLKAIAAELSLGLESLVFLDDNPAERSLVRELLSQVAVPELPDDPALFATTLAAAGYFESLVFSEEDLKRAAYYQDNARRVALSQHAGDIETYLASLKMEITFQPFDETGRPRIAQLINKSNQFNLTTHRYTETEVAAIEKNPNYFTLQARLSDIFGDNGMISVVICKTTPDSDWEIDTWLMSCRVLGRQVESAVLHEIIGHARRSSVRKLIGIYRPTGRNKLVEQHYPKLGFTQVQQQEDGTTIWELGTAEARVEAAPISVRSMGFAEMVEV
jgi:FkbH-like protein